MKIIDKIKINKFEGCGNKNPLIIMQESIKKIKNCDEGVELEFNDYDWLISIKDILKIMQQDIKLKIIENRIDNGYISLDVVADC
ncbi:MAG: hypothetical protein ACP5I6_04640 [Caldisphaera sp.]|jgi:ATP-dependent RNA circularization protein (DNA/RNA ligase family)|nr:hypothetical protein [Caldisphaera sp.]